ncbi:UbiA prenyltransferase family-domain-containing protein [Mycena rebaudengoi]|nr:UbiA prenyltransferase family-domain-containing protein [Mycena rebaudengoi]
MNKLLELISYEFDIFFAFTWRDWTTTIIPGSTWAVGAIATGQPSAASLLYRLPRLVVWLTLYIYFFNLTNQITGIDEDRVNKPGRPLPSGQITLRGAKMRWLAVFVAFIATAIPSPSLLAESAIWVLTAAFLCLTTAGAHWFGKNCVGMFIGPMTLLSASWRAIAPLTPPAQRYILAISLWVGATANIQDLRDVEGDQAVGRKTLTIVYGDAVARRIIFGSTVFLAVGILWWGGVLAIAPVSLVLVHWFLAYRVVHAVGGPRYDHKTYMKYTYTFCYILALVLFKDAFPSLPR